MLSDFKVREMVNERSRLFGETLPTFWDSWLTAGESAKTMAADMEASFLLSNRMLSDAYEVASGCATGCLTNGAGMQPRQAQS